MPLLLPPPPSAHALADILLSLSAARSLPKGQQLHAHLFKSGFLPSSRLLSNHLITLYSRCSLPHLSQLAFHDSPHPPSPTSFSALIAAFSKNDLPVPSLSAFRLMLSAPIPPSDRSLPSVFKSAAILRSSPLARSLHSLALRCALHQDLFVGSSLVDCYAKCALLEDAMKAFEEMPSRNVVSWSGLISGYSHAGHDLDALRLFKLALESEDLREGANDFTYSCVLRVCGNSTLLELGAQLHARVFETGFGCSPFVGSSLISLYSKCGMVDDAYKVFDEMPDYNLGAWNAILIASAQHGHTASAFARFESMQAAGFQANFITFLCLLTACSHAGLVEEGKQYFAMMTAHRVEPGPQHYACMVDLLGRAGKLSEAVSFVETMPIAPTESVWGALLTGCRIHGDTETAAFAACKLFETGSSSSGAHMLLANAYAAVGQFVDAARTRKAMRDRGVKKETGLSWVELGGKVHTFVSGDMSHSRSEEIHQLLDELEEKMEREGYVADTSVVLREVGGEEKRRSVWRHSERLAIAFGLLSLPEGRPIRVMKNLRVCPDCHTAIKFLTKVVGRTVILRDNNRFHRFENGACSCGDYW